MQKLISRVCCLVLVVLVIVACLPFSAFAVDPVSAGVMANAFAQAIAAYGASNGVAMTFDVTSTDGIGESVHELWKDFREGTQDADDYATLAAALFPDLYYKATTVVAGASDVYTVGYNISSTYAEEFDNFYNWLLSGPAEMVKVDNAYYQFSQAQIGPDSSPLNVYTMPGLFAGQPLPVFVSGMTNQQAFDSSFKATPVLGNGNIQYGILAGSSDCYAFRYGNGSSTYKRTVVVASLSSPVQRYQTEMNYGSYYISGGNDNVSSTSYSGVTIYYTLWNSSAFNSMSYVPHYDTINDAWADVYSALSGSEVPDTLGVKASTNTGVAEFPDTTDPNYEAVAKQIPSTVPWDNTAYGDGTGALTDAQAGAIAAGADTVIARDGVLDLAGTDEITDEPGTDDPPTSDPDDYVVPGLADIFPFCIPFDIYNFLSALAAAPVAPHFTATLDFPEAVGGTQTIDIDFDSPTWNQLAQLLRLLELLAFIIGLALLTRSMFIRG